MLSKSHLIGVLATVAVVSVAVLSISSAVSHSSNVDIAALYAAAQPKPFEKADWGGESHLLSADGEVAPQCRCMTLEDKNKCMSVGDADCIPYTPASFHARFYKVWAPIFPGGDDVCRDSACGNPTVPQRIARAAAVVEACQEMLLQPFTAYTFARQKASVTGDVNNGMITVCLDKPTSSDPTPASMFVEWETRGSTSAYAYRLMNMYGHYFTGGDRRHGPSYVTSVCLAALQEYAEQYEDFGPGDECSFQQ